MMPGWNFPEIPVSMTERLHGSNPLGAITAMKKWLLSPFMSFPEWEFSWQSDSRRLLVSER